MSRTAKCLDAVARLKVGGAAQTLDNLSHALMVEHSGDEMRESRDNFTSASGRQVREQGCGKLTPHVSEGVAIEEEERSAAMALPQKLYGFVERKDLPLLCCPVACARRLSLSIKAVLRASSCARSSVEADDKLPTPVFEKFGSGL